MIPVTFALPAFILGILFLYKGSDILVDGTSKTAAQFGVSSLIISVIVVAFGTSSPEFAISVGAAAQNQAADRKLTRRVAIGAREIARSTKSPAAR